MLPRGFDLCHVGTQTFEQHLTLGGEGEELHTVGDLLTAADLTYAHEMRKYCVI